MQNFRCIWKESGQLTHSYVDEYPKVLYKLLQKLLFQGSRVLAHRISDHILLGAREMASLMKELIIDLWLVSWLISIVDISGITRENTGYLRS